MTKTKNKLFFIFLSIFITSCGAKYPPKPIFTISKDPTELEIEKRTKDKTKE